ncbi:MAG TPA: TonB-dependent receptor [Bacteroidia bacterium]|nr:TonB-dependent receptor [Bacteroidia bacterium]
MKKFIGFLILFQSLYFELWAQEINFKGKVEDAANAELLIGAVINFGKNKITNTNLDGEFSISLTEGKHPIKITLMGYKNVVDTVMVDANLKMLHYKLEKSVRELDQVVISAGKYEQKLSEITVSMDVIKPKIVENKNTVNLETIADQVPGVTVTDGQVSIRGGSGFSYGAGSRVLMCVDEMPMLAADAGDIKWSYLPIENLEQIEVIKGASSALFGSSALNGVINVRTAYPKEKPESKVTFFAGIYDNPKRGNLKWWDSNPTTSGSSFFHAQKAGNFDLVASGNVFNDEGYRQGENELRGRFNINIKYNFKNVKGLSIGLNSNAMQTTGGLFILWQNADSGGYIPQAGTLSNYVTTRSNYDPFVTYFTKKGDKHTLRTRYFNTTNKNNTNQESTAELYYGEYQYRHLFKKNGAINIGAVATRSVILSDSLYGFHEGANYAMYAQIDKRFFNRLSVSLGLRGEYFKIDDEESVTDVNIYTKTDTTILLKAVKMRPVMRFGLNFQAFEYTFVRASFGQGYRFPSVAEKYVQTSVGALTIFPNKQLQPETGTSAEVGIKQGFKIANWNGFIDVAAFSTTYRNMMEFAFGIYFPDTVPLQYQQYLGNKLKYLGFKSINVSNARINGIEATIAGNGKIGPLDISLFAGYTYTQPLNLNYNPNLDTNKTENANVLKYRFFHNVKGDLQIDYKKFSVGLSCRYNSNIINIDDSFQKPVFGYIIPGATFGPTILPGLENYRKIHNTGNLYFDFRFGYQITSGNKVSLIVNNLMNTENMGRPGDMQAPRLWMLQYVTKF